ncbi:MAG: penicillin-binding protein 2 [Actinomycetota bacterium]|nr:penicillin-binding protein 2 [Actinomycetota bacterium]
MATSKKPHGVSASRARIALIGLAVVAAWVGMGYRLVQIQVVQASEFAEKGLSQRFVSEDLAPQRGKIFDRNGELLAMTVESKSLYAVPGQVEEPRWVAQQLGALLDVDSEVLYDRLTSDRDFVFLKRQVDGVLAEELLGLDIRGVYGLPEPKRIYPAGAVASHVAGFVNIDGAGQEGLELVYDLELTGTPGKATFERSLDGKVIPLGTNNIVPAVPGMDLITTIDLPLQYQAQQSCIEGLKRTGGKACWVVVLEVETGEILAMTGAPVFDPETRETLDPDCESAEDSAACKSFSNFSIRGIYEPGSTQKLITVAAAIEEGEVSIGTVIPEVADELELLEGACRSADDDLYGCYRDFKEHPTKDMSVAEIFVRSSNIGTIRIADTLGQDRLISYIEAFGLGSKTGVDYSAEASGILNFEAGCKTCWASAAIGYSVAATPLQMAAAYAAVGNDGVWLTPHIVAAIADTEGETEVAGFRSQRVISSGTSILMRDLLASVVEEGTGQAAAVDGYRVGGKTGTANRLDENGRYTEETRASFVGMAPIHDPKVVVAVLIDSPSFDFRTGGASAAPIFAEVMEQALYRLGVAPDGRAR